MRNVTLSDIAKKTGYSVNTVSHALHDRPDISEKTKKYISGVAEEMGYIANLSAGALRSGKSKSVAIIVGDISNPHFSIMIKEMEGTLREYGYTAIIFNTDENEEIERGAIKSAISKNVDGILICPVQKTSANLDFLVANGIPFVLFGRRFEGVSSNYVICDDINGGYMAALHLIERDHQKLLFINAPCFISSARDRLEGVKRAVHNHQVQKIDLQVITMEHVMSDQEEKLSEMLDTYSSCSGVICFSDLVAMRVCHYLLRKGKKVPKDVAVIGFDNIGSKLLFPTLLTSVTSSKTKMSVEAVTILMRKIENSDFPVQQVILPTKVVPREST